MTLVFAGLCIVSITQAKETPITPAEIMRTLIPSAKNPVDGCPSPEDFPEEEACKGFFRVDNEDILKNLVENYTNCLDGNPYYYNFSNQPEIELTKTLHIYSRTAEPLTISGLKLVRGDSFPSGKPPIVIFGNGVLLNDIHLEGFDAEILFVKCP